MTNQTEQGAAPEGVRSAVLRLQSVAQRLRATADRGRAQLGDGYPEVLQALDAVKATLECLGPAASPTSEGYTSDGWISVDDRLPAFAEDAEDDGVKVYTWDGELVTEDEFMPEYEQPAGPAVGGWMRTGEWFASDNLHRVTHWMPRRLPAGPVAAATAKEGSAP